MRRDMAVFWLLCLICPARLPRDNRFVLWLLPPRKRAGVSERWAHASSLGASFPWRCFTRSLVSREDFPPVGKKVVDRHPVGYFEVFLCRFGGRAPTAIHPRCFDCLHRSTVCSREVLQWSGPVVCHRCFHSPPGVYQRPRAAISVTFDSLHIFVAVEKTKEFATAGGGRGHVAVGSLCYRRGLLVFIAWEHFRVLQLLFDGGRGSSNAAHPTFFFPLVSGARWWCYLSLRGNRWVCWCIFAASPRRPPLLAVFQTFKKGRFQRAWCV